MWITRKAASTTSHAPSLSGFTPRFKSICGLAIPVLLVSQVSLSTPVRPWTGGEGVVSVAMEPSPGFETAAVMAGVPMGVELAPVPASARVRLGRPLATVSFPPNAQVTLGDLLAKMLQSVSGYEMSVDRGVVSIAPSNLLHDPTHFLNRKVAPLDLVNVPLQEAIAALWSNRAGASPSVTGSQPSGQVGGGSGRGADTGARFQRLKSVLSRNVTVSLKDSTLRDGLNRLAELSGEFVWEVSYQSGTQANEHTCILQVTPVGELGGYGKGFLCR